MHRTPLYGAVIYIERVFIMEKKLLLYGITDSAFDSMSLESQLEAAVLGGATMIQLREKNIFDDDYIQKAKNALSITRKYNIPLIINDNVRVALESGADGVHLGQTDCSPYEARRILGDKAIIGVTAKTVSQAVAAEKSGADYLGSGAVFTSPTKPDAKGISFDELKEICSCVNIPVCAIGGIGIDNAVKLRGSGIKGIAVVSALFSSQTAEGIITAAKELKTAAEEAVL